MGLFDRFRKKQQTEYHPNSALHAYTGKKPYIFISYAHADASIVMPEIFRLNELGYNVWFDEGISPGNEWTEEIARALNNCELFLVFLTPNSAASKNVANEINYALDEDKKFLSVFLKNANLSGGLKLSIMSKQAILKYLMNDSEYVYKLTTGLNNLNIYRNDKNHGQKYTVPDSSAVPASPAVADSSAAFAAADTSKNQTEKTDTHRQEMDAIIARVMNSPARPIDFEWEGNALKSYHGIAKKVSVPDRAERIMTEAFAGKPAEEIVLPESVKTIDSFAFKNCKELKNIVILNKNVSFSDKSIILNCPKSTVSCVENSNTHKNLLTVYTGPVTYLKSESNNQNDTAEQISRRVETDAVIARLMNSPARSDDFEWEGNALKGYHGIAKKFAVPDRAERIMTEAFAGLPAEEIALPESVKTIDSFAFKNCKELKNIVILNKNVSFSDKSIILNCPKSTVSCVENSNTHKNLLTVYTGPVTYLKSESSNQNDSSAGQIDRSSFFAPKGVAEILMKDGTIHNACANSLLRRYMGISTGIRDRYNNMDSKYVAFRDMDSFECIKDSIGRVSKIIVTDFEGTEEEFDYSGAYSEHELLFLPSHYPIAKKLTAVKMENVQKVTFYHRGYVPPIPFHHGKIVMADGKESYFPLASAFIMKTDRTTSGLSTTILDSVPFENEPPISLSRIRTLEVSSVLSSPSPFSPMCKAELKVTDMYDDVVTDTVYGDLTVCVLTKKGVKNTGFDNIKRIEFFEE